eukprot:1161784-Pelagomonas_calceolata.AAC.4
MSLQQDPTRVRSVVVLIRRSGSISKDCTPIQEWKTSREPFGKWSYGGEKEYLRTKRLQASCLFLSEGADLGMI